MWTPTGRSLSPVDQRTTRVLASLNYQSEKAFGKATFHYSKFDNKFLGVTYDNPFWFNDVTGSGALRGLWEKGRASQEPANEAWDMTFSGGYNLPARTRVSAVVSFGEQTQNVSFLPITTNSQTVGLLDINGDGVINELDNPTNTSAFNSSFIFGGVPTISNGLDATTETTNLDFSVTSKPMDGLKLLGRYRYHAPQGKEGIQSVQARTDYIESRLWPPGTFPDSTGSVPTLTTPQRPASVCSTTLRRPRRSTSWSTTTTDRSTRRPSTRSSLAG